MTERLGIAPISGTVTRPEHAISQEISLSQLLTPRLDGISERWKAEIKSGQELKDLIAHRLLAKKFRKSPAGPLLAARVRQAVSHCLKTDAPLRLFVPMGGYKSPASPEFPRVGWAELFAVAGLAAIVAPTCEFHAAGAVVEFSSDEMIVPRLTGAGRPVLDAYKADFDRVLSLARPYLPPNLHLCQSFLRDSYDEAGLTRMIGALGRRLEAEWFPSLSRHHQERLLRSAASNRFRGTGAGSPAPEAEVGRDVLRRAVCEHQAFLQIDDEYRSSIFTDSCTIPVALRRGLPDWLHLGSNHRSATQFWIGFGVVDSAPQSPAAHILPPGRAAAVVPEARYVPTRVTDIRGLGHMPVIAGLPVFSG
jgi:hypothetical protein